MEMKIISGNSSEEFEQNVNQFFKENEENHYVVIDREFEVTMLNNHRMFTAFFVIQKIPDELLDAQVK